MVAVVDRRLGRLVTPHGRPVPHRRVVEAAGVLTAPPGPVSATVALEVAADGTWCVTDASSLAGWTSSSRRDAIALVVSVTVGAGLTGRLRVTVRSHGGVRWVGARVESRCRRAHAVRRRA